MSFSTVLHVFWTLPAVIYQSSVQVWTQITSILLFVSFFLAIAFHVGWVNRFLTWTMERELSKLLNHTPVTVGSLQVDLLRGRGIASNLILHAPKRPLWKWQSPVVARIGKVYVECNFVTCLLSLWFLWEEVPLDIYTVEVSDIQGFVERKQSIFNFYLLDPHIDVPNPTIASISNDGRDNNNEDEEADDDDNMDDEIPMDTTLSPSTTPTRRNLSSGSATSGWERASSASGAVEDTASSVAAQQLVDDMVRALGRATQQGSFHSALLESRERLKQQLKAFQKTQSRSKTEVMQVGVQLVQQVSKSLVEKSQTVPQLVVPQRKKPSDRSLPRDKIVYGRVGRVVLRDLRVFTRDHHFDQQQIQHQQRTVHGNTHDMAEQDNIVDNDDDNDDPRNISTMTTSSVTDNNSGGGWNKPIWLEQVILRSAELGPNLSSKDHEQPNLPAVFQPLDRCFEIIWKRVLAEVAKSNTGAFFQTAVGEVLDYYMEPTATSTTTSSTTATSAAATHLPPQPQQIPLS